MAEVNNPKDAILAKLIGGSHKAVVLVIGVVVLILASGSYEIVDAGHRGVSVINGKVGDRSLEEGFYWKIPFIERIYSIDARTLKWEADTHCYTKDVQQARIKFAVNYNLQPEMSHTVYKEVGVTWDKTLLPQVVETTIKSVIGRWDAVDLVSNRDKARGEIQIMVTEALKPKHILVTNFSLNNIDYEAAFERAVEAKVVAIQQAIEAKNNTVKIEEEAKQIVISAKAEAESMRIRSQALSQNRGLVEYEAVQKWDGKLPEYMLGGSTPFINLNSVKK
jgi:regulator of protease activity HflC (stomatin/prohibitin superfamily)